MTRKKEINFMVECVRLGVKVYPVYQYRDVYRKKVLVYEKDNWYIEVDSNGDLIRYPKSIGTGKVLNSSKLQGPVDKTYEHLYGKLQGVLNGNQ